MSASHEPQKREKRNNEKVAVNMEGDIWVVQSIYKSIIIKVSPSSLGRLNFGEGLFLPGGRLYGAREYGLGRPRT